MSAAVIATRKTDSAKAGDAVAPIERTKQAAIAQLARDKIMGDLLLPGRHPQTPTKDVWARVVPEDAWRGGQKSGDAAY
jgi:hypothetical protein